MNRRKGGGGRREGCKGSVEIDLWEGGRSVVSSGKYEGRNLVAENKS